jgi:hypothetical protein
VIETEQLGFVFRRQQPVEEVGERAARVHHALAAHAVADVEREREADGHALPGELRNGLRHAVFFDDEVRLRERGDQPAFRVADGDGGCHQLRAAAEVLVAQIDRPLIRAE